MINQFDLERIYNITPENIFDDEVWNAIHSSIYELLKRKARENQAPNMYDAKLNHYAGEIFTHYRETHEIYDFNYKHLEDFVYFVERDIMNIAWGDEGRKDMNNIFKTVDNKTYFEHKLGEIGLLKNGWVSGANEISTIAINYAKKLLEKLSNEDLRDWDIAPFVNGSILLSYNTYTKNRACINLAEKGVSYFHEYPYKCIWDTYLGGWDKGFSKVVELIKNIHETNK
jgi:hypothetical protein